MRAALAWAYDKGNREDRWIPVPAELAAFWSRQERRRK
jgi:hypothetical protein